MSGAGKMGDRGGGRESTKSLNKSKVGANDTTQRETQTALFSSRVA